MFEQIIAGAQRLASEPGVRAVVLHGEGPSFCSGLDVVGLMAAGGGMQAGLADRVRGDVPNWFQRAAHDWLTVPMPVIAALHGTCFGGGLQIALGADIRIAAPDARLSVMEVKWGLVPDMSISADAAPPRVDRRGQGWPTPAACSTVWRRTELGVVTGWPGSLAAARELASGDRPAVTRTRSAQPSGCTTSPGRRRRPASLALEAELQLRLIGSPNQLAAVSAGFTKQPAEFVDS